MISWIKSVVQALVAVAVVAIVVAIGYLIRAFAHNPLPGQTIAIDPISLVRRLLTPVVAAAGIGVFIVFLWLIRHFRIA